MLQSFIRYFRGLKLSVVENDGYIFNFNPNELSAIIYYKYDKTENNTTTRTQGSYTLDLGSSNVHFNQIQYNRSNTFVNHQVTLIQVEMLNFSYKEMGFQVQNFNS